MFEEADKTVKEDKEQSVKKDEAEEKVPKEKPVDKQDFLLVELTGRLEDTGEVFETTDEETAKTAGFQSEGRNYGPRVVVVGEGWVLKGLDAGLIGLKVGSEEKIEVQPEDAFGTRDLEKVRMIPYRLLRSKGVTPSLGAQIEYEGRTAVVRSMGAGRVQLDYNHPYAGRKLVYNVKILKRFMTEQEKIRALMTRRFLGFDAEKFGLKISKKKVSIEVPEEILYTENLQLVKRGLALDIMRFFEKIEEVSFSEVIKKEASGEKQS